ncbi:uncharacterized protein LOC108112872 [Drosophila eugracilis]|uniref:uncharacterized protein LOC108112872 n=1 Tax=Drosophila eugracilis TaxID=29029 RepID=UPI0007E7424E|nr:uncharacterized protein LOC108112872 [Drosophila eugracilis]
MVVVQGMYEITELVAGSIGCVGLYMAGCNALPMDHISDLPAALFVLSTVFLLHHVRVINWPPLQELWRLLLELVVFYMSTQLLVWVVWHQFHNFTDILRDLILNTRLAMNILESFPKIYMFLRQDVFYLGKLIVSLACTYKAIKVTHVLDYAIPRHRAYRYYKNQPAARRPTKKSKNLRRPKS